MLRNQWLVDRRLRRPRNHGGDQSRQDFGSLVVLQRGVGDETCSREVPGEFKRLVEYERRWPAAVSWERRNV